MGFRETKIAQEPTRSAYPVKELERMTLDDRVKAPGATKTDQNPTEIDQEMIGAMENVDIIIFGDGQTAPEVVTSLEESLAPYRTISNPDDLTAETYKQLDLTQPTRLVLLHLLANDEWFEKCRPRDTESSWDGYPEFDIQPLALAWRKALRGVPPIPRLIFDLTLPPKPDSQDRRPVEWRGQSDKKGPVVLQNDAIKLTNLLATTMKMRLQGGKIAFDVVWELGGLEFYHNLNREMVWLRQHLWKLAGHPPVGKSGSYPGAGDTSRGVVESKGGHDSRRSENDGAQESEDYDTEDSWVLDLGI